MGIYGIVKHTHIYIYIHGYKYGHVWSYQVLKTNKIESRKSSYGKYMAERLRIVETMG